MPTIQDLLTAAKAKTITVSECVDVLTASEGVRANSVWQVEGHPLQHSYQDPAGAVRRLEDTYHFRGPLPIEKELKGGPNIGNFKAAIKIAPDGSFTPGGNTFHSQFRDDLQAGMCLKLILESGGGIWALDVLKNNPRVSVTVVLGMPGGTEFFEREAQLVGVGAPSSNVVPKGDMSSARNFVWFQRRDMGSVTATLRSKDSPLGHLHAQTLYPSIDPMAAGSSTAEVTAKSPTDYSGPLSVTFS
ncbi:hypothetical protein OJF2_71370 [Aquisphaera giovannonii]|uniref:Uncharacterized protein n=1 Tax=Aquisphaera giovannonii TaxID=406548 RepID=A0A5B9WE99_9BACT|nr:hypothetical protein [Aquisphaera giovannonii]QEH38534.1 hypothetical protein OJF2_71370 [Aquisphaera giovannonii]